MGANAAASDDVTVWATLGMTGGGMTRDGIFLGTPNYASSSNTCEYNIATDCNSDCWIKNFSNCVDGASGSGISIASPCW